ncbi:MAG TPA: hypothetical protein VKD91_11050 [Pyrinomonadaceae bacterium]|nr:hypothetical protein [Pyrinomonadaceae bacterium]
MGQTPSLLPEGFGAAKPGDFGKQFAGERFAVRAHGSSFGPRDVEQ